MFIQEHGPHRGLIKTREKAQQGGFTRAVGSQKGGEGASIEEEGKPVQSVGGVIGVRKMKLSAF
jgi:hypothetical protein